MGVTQDSLKMQRCVPSRLRNKFSKFYKISSVKNKIVLKILWLCFSGHSVLSQFSVCCFLRVLSQLTHVTNYCFTPICDFYRVLGYTWCSGLASRLVFCSSCGMLYRRSWPFSLSRNINTHCLHVK